MLYNNKRTDMESFINTCECCNKQYNFGNPYFCEECIPENYYDDEDSCINEDNYFSIDEMFNNK